MPENLQIRLLQTEASKISRQLAVLINGIEKLTPILEVMNSKDHLESSTIDIQGQVVETSGPVKPNRITDTPPSLKSNKDLSSRPDRDVTAIYDVPQINENDIKNIDKSDGSSFLLFYSAGCGPCKSVMKFIYSDKIKNGHLHDSIYFIASDNPLAESLSKFYKSNALPHLLLVDKSTVVDSYTGDSIIETLKTI